jgi:hypothetical protein
MAKILQESSGNPNVVRFMELLRHARACRGHPRLYNFSAEKTWMARISPAMTDQKRFRPSAGCA